MPASPLLQLFRNARLYAPEARGVVDILVAGDRIAAIGRDLAAPPPGWGCVVHELDGALCVPGLIDAHVHLSGGGGESGPETKVPPLHLTQLTRAGVTTVVGLLGTDGTTRHPRELLAATHAMRRLGLTAHMWTGAYPVPTPTLTGSVQRDIVEIDAVIGAGEIAISDHRSSQPTFDEIARLAAECHVGGLLAGKAGVLHLHLGDGGRGLQLVRRLLEETEIPARVLQPTHCNRNPRLWQESLDLGARGLPIDVTAFPPDDDDEALPAARAVEMWLDLGLPTDRLTLSSDGGGCLPVWDRDGAMVRMDVGSSATLLGTLATLHRAGRELSDVLPLLTRNVARQLRLRGKGEVAVGADADLLVLDDAFGVRHLLARGRPMILAGEPIALGPFEVGGGAA